MTTVKPQIVLDTFPDERLPELWDWLWQYPTANFDDSGPASLEEFQQLMAQRKANPDWGCIGVSLEGVLVGAVGYFLLPGSTVVLLRGVCFDKSVHGTGVASAAFQEALDMWWSEGKTQVCAMYMSDNHRIQRFFDKLGGQPWPVDLSTLRAGCSVKLHGRMFYAPKKGKR